MTFHATLKQPSFYVQLIGNVSIIALYHGGYISAAVGIWSYFFESVILLFVWHSQLRQANKKVLAGKFFDQQAILFGFYGFILLYALNTAAILQALPFAAVLGLSHLFANKRRRHLLSSDHLVAERVQHELRRRIIPLHVAVLVGSIVPLFGFTMLSWAKTITDIALFDFDPNRRVV